MIPVAGIVDARLTVWNMLEQVETAITGITIPPTTSDHRSFMTDHLGIVGYGRGRGVGRGLGVGVTLAAGVGVAVGVADGVEVGLGVGVGVGATGTIA